MRAVGFAMACVVVGCVAQMAEEGDKTSARLEAGKADDGVDLCERFDWYGDGECDEFCTSPDPDCAFGEMCRDDGDCPVINCVRAPCPSNTCIDGACEIDSPIDACPPGERECDGCLGQSICVSHRLDCPMLLCPDLNTCESAEDCPTLEAECRTTEDCPTLNCVRAPCPTNVCVEGACVADLPSEECRDDERVCEGCLGVLYCSPADLECPQLRCAASVCGDGIVSGDEECDGDEGCTAECTFGPRCRDDERVCEGCLGVLYCSPADRDCPQLRCAASVCGDGIVSGDEECDGGDGCTDWCTLDRAR